MKKAIFAALLFAPVFGWAAPSSSEYSVSVQVQSSRLILRCEPAGFAPYCQHMQYFTAIIDGKKLELDSTQTTNSLLRVGTYMAKVVHADPPNAYETHLEYEFLFPDGKTRKYLVVGEDE